MALDNVDQLTLSEKMHKVLRGIWKRESNGHMLVTTRRERKEMCRCVDVEPNCFVEVTSFSILDRICLKSSTLTRITKTKGGNK